MSRIIIVTFAVVAVVAIGIGVYNANAPFPPTTESNDATEAASEASPLSVSDMSDPAATAGSAGPGPTPVTREAIAELRDLIDQFATEDIMSPERDFTNDEAAPDAIHIDRSEATDPAYISEALNEEDFDIERIVALIHAAPRLTETQRADLQTAVQAIVIYPEARDEVLAKLETILLSLI